MPKFDRKPSESAPTNLFGGPEKAVPIHRAEFCLVVMLSIHVSLMAWALGGTLEWVQIGSLTLSIVEICLALFPRRFCDQDSGSLHYKVYMWPKLVKFRIFWIGVLFLFYISIQTLNPAAEFVTNGSVWWIRSLNHIEWLPSCVSAPFFRGNSIQALLWYLSVLISGCAVWVGITRRRSLAIFLVSICTSGFALAIVGVLQKALDAKNIFWLIKPPAAYFVGSFIYKNHGGAYFNIIFGLCAGLALWYYLRGIRRLDKSNPGVLFAFYAIVCAVMVIFSYSRAAAILLAVYSVYGLSVFLRSYFSVRSSRTSILIPGAISLLLGTFMLLGFVCLKTEAVLNHMELLVTHGYTSEYASRGVAAKATIAMGLSKPVFGWGAYSFQYAFPIYQRKAPEIWSVAGHHLFWEHAHNDYAELFAEYGIFGGIILLFMLLTFVVYTVRSGCWSNPLGSLVLPMLLVTLIHAGVDFIFFNPAIVITWFIVLVSVIKWSELESNRT